MKKYRVTVNGTAYEVELEELTGAAPAPAAAPAYGVNPTAPAAPAYGVNPAAPAAPAYQPPAPGPAAATPPWNTASGVNPITGQPM